MKRRNLISRTAICLYLVLTCVFSVGCTRGDSLKNQNSFNDYEVIVIDECEYINWGVSYGYMNITHKGNCKYCAERAKANALQHVNKVHCPTILNQKSQIINPQSEI
jgi:hypothetical protein